MLPVDVVRYVNDTRQEVATTPAIIPCERDRRSGVWRLAGMSSLSSGLGARVRRDEVERNVPHRAVHRTIPRNLESGVWGRSHTGLAGA